MSLALRHTNPPHSPTFAPHHVHISGDCSYRRTKCLKSQHLSRAHDGRVSTAYGPHTAPVATAAPTLPFSATRLRR
eukprot:54192-Eustigmatos_ZCMA.PRE.1